MSYEQGSQSTSHANSAPEEICAVAEFRKAYASLFRKQTMCISAAARNRMLTPSIKRITDLGEDIRVKRLPSQHLGVLEVSLHLDAARHVLIFLRTQQTKIGRKRRQTHFHFFLPSSPPRCRMKAFALFRQRSVAIYLPKTHDSERLEDNKQFTKTNKDTSQAQYLLASGDAWKKDEGTMMMRRTDASKPRDKKHTDLRISASWKGYRGGVLPILRNDDSA